MGSRSWGVGLSEFVGHPMLSAIVSVLVMVLNVLNLVSLPVSRCPSVTPPAMHIDAACRKTGTRAMLGDIVTPLRRRVGNIRGVVCVASATAGAKSTSVRICFGRKASPSVTTIGIRGHITGTRNFLPTRIAGMNIVASGQRADVLLIFSLCDSSSGCSGRFLRGCTGVGIVPRMRHMPNMNSTVMVKSSCSVHV